MSRSSARCGQSARVRWPLIGTPPLFKVLYGWGLRRTEAAQTGRCRLGPEPAAPEFGRFGTLHVRYGKAKRGQPPRRRNVASVMGWAVDAVTDYVENIRPRFGCVEHAALWVTERGGRIKPAEINARFVAYRDALGLPKALVPHSMRHSYVSHLTEDGVDRRFIQCQVGHEVDSSTAVYTHVSSDFMNTALRRALAPALGDAPAGWGGAMTAKLDYRWHLRQVMAARGMFATTDLLVPLAERGIRLSSSQVYRLVVERPERLSLKALMALLDILDTTMDELIEPVAAEPAKQTRAAVVVAGSGTCGPGARESRGPTRDGPTAACAAGRGAGGDGGSDRHRGGGGDGGRSHAGPRRGPPGRRAGQRWPGQAPPPGHGVGRRCVGVDQRTVPRSASRRESPARAPRGRSDQDLPAVVHQLRAGAVGDATSRAGLVLLALLHTNATLRLVRTAPAGHLPRPARAAALLPVSRPRRP